MNEHHKVEDVKIDNGTISLIVDGQIIQRNLREISTLLEKATDDELKVCEVSPSGYGIHWPMVDEDISIDGLLGIKHYPDSMKKSA